MTIFKNYHEDENQGEPNKTFKKNTAKPNKIKQKLAKLEKKN